MYAFIIYAATIWSFFLQFIQTFDIYKKKAVTSVTAFYIKLLLTIIQQPLQKESLQKPLCAT